MAKKQKTIWYLWEMPHALPSDGTRKGRSTPLQFTRVWTQSSMHYGGHRSTAKLRFFAELFDRLEKLTKSKDGYAKLGIYTLIKGAIGSDRIAGLRGFMVGQTGCPLNATDVARLIRCPDVALVSATIKTMKKSGLLIKTGYDRDMMIHVIQFDVTTTPVLPDGSLCAMYDPRLLPKPASDDADETPVLPDGSDEAEDTTGTPEGHAPDTTETDRDVVDDTRAEDNEKPPPIEDSDQISPAVAGPVGGDIETVRRRDVETSSTKSDTTCGPDTVKQKEKTIPIETPAAQGDAETPSRYEGGPGQGIAYEIMPENRKAAYVAVDPADAVGPDDKFHVGGSQVADRGSEAGGSQIVGSREAANDMPKDTPTADYSGTIESIAWRVMKALYPTDESLVMWGRKNDPPMELPRFKEKEFQSLRKVIAGATTPLLATGQKMSAAWMRLEQYATSCATQTREKATPDQRSIGASWCASMKHKIPNLCRKLGQ